MADVSRPDQNGGQTRGAIRRWLAIILPIVLIARGLLLVVQLHGGRHPHPDAPVLPQWPVVAGETLHFRSSDPAIKALGTGAGHRINVVLLEREGIAQPADTGCVLDPVAMADGWPGGTLTIRSRTAQHSWIVDWSGAGTVMPLDRAGSLAGKPSSAVEGKLEAAMLAAASCGMWARLDLDDNALHALVNLLSRLPPPLPDPGIPKRSLNIRVDAPPPG